MNIFCEQILENFIPILNATLKSVGATVNVLSEQKAEIVFPFPVGRLLEDWVEQYQKKKAIYLKIKHVIGTHRVQSTLKPLPKIKNCIAIASGKGGVGKSTVTANFAIALAKLGAKVGVLDADLYGPSQPLMLGASDQKAPSSKSVDGRYLKPVRTHHGIQVMSMGYLLKDDKTPVIWRGPMASKALQQLLFETLWEDLDYLLIDLPPGTGDIQLTLCQKIPLSGSIIVSTPQNVALLDVRKAIAMFEKTGVAILGMVENMSGYHCPVCHHFDPVFDQDCIETLKSSFDIDCLGKIPLDRSIRESVDTGNPTTLLDSDPIAVAYVHAAWDMLRRLSYRPKSYASKFPDVVVETTSKVAMISNNTEKR